MRVRSCAGGTELNTGRARTGKFQMSQIEQRLSHLSPAKRELLRQLAAQQRSEKGRIQAGPRPSRIPLTFATRPHMAAFAYLLIPDNLKGPAPAVVVAAPELRNTN